jgi:hypothetical protein
MGCAILSNELEYKPTLRNSIASVSQAIQMEVFDIIDFLGYSRKEFILTSYPVTISRVDGKPVSDILINCIRSRLCENYAKKQI